MDKGPINNTPGTAPAAPGRSAAPGTRAPSSVQHAPAYRDDDAQANGLRDRLAGVAAEALPGQFTQQGLERAARVLIRSLDVTIAGSDEAASAQADEGEEGVALSPAIRAYRSIQSFD